ncbi:MAG: DUF512 domain-containing protein [Clostridiales bacterium]|nr:DUF512 domain-containing protein [Clostridiales bacterium]
MSTKIASVDARSPAERAGIRPGEELRTVNGNPIVDVLDYKFYTYDTRLVLTLADESGRERKLRVRKREGQELGLNFETYLMDKCHRCANNCIFCFVDQMPAGLRDTLYFKDDDERLSFLMGNYITLTNLSQREIQRIIDLRISPINVSVHTTDPELRVKMMGNRFAGRSIDIMRRFAEAGIQMNCQIVACPGVNDGPALERSMNDLTAMRNGVASVAIVPVGLTKYREGLYPLRTYTQAEAAAVLDMVEAYGDQCLAEFGRRMFWCSDEFYLLAKRELPSDDFYEDYCQLENGVGMLRLFQVEFRGALRMMEGETFHVRPFSMATGRAAAPLLTRLATEATAQFGGEGQVYEIRNDFFGPEITVAGLVTGRDLIAQLKGRELGERLLLPDCMLRYHQNVFLDDVTVEQVEEALGVPVTFVAQDGFKLLDAILETEGAEEPEEADFFPEDDEYFRYNPDL